MGRLAQVNVQTDDSLPVVTEGTPKSPPTTHRRRFGRGSLRDLFLSPLPVANRTAPSGRHRPDRVEQ